MRWPPFVFVALLLAGCADSSDGGPEDVDPSEVGNGAEQATDQSSSPPPSQPETTGPGEGNEPEGGSAVEPASVTIVQTPVSVEGHLGLGAAQGGSTIAFIQGTDRWFPHGVPGNVIGASFTMTWDSDSPLTESLLLGFGIYNEGEDSAEDTIVVRGSSPLTLTSDTAWDTGRVVVWAWFSADPFVEASAFEEFAIEGTITSAAPAETPPA